MAKALVIKAKDRENKKPNQIRREGFIPATVYGHGFTSKSIQINAKEFSKVPHKAYSHINELEINGENLPVIIRNVQTDPVYDEFLNIEFYRIKSDEKIKVKVPLNYIGHSPAVVAGGVLIVSLNEIDVQCLPKDIPDFIEVNLEDIKEIGQGIQAKDLKMPEHIQVLTRTEELLAKVEIPRTHEVEEKVVTPEAAVPGAAPAAEAQAPAAGIQAATSKEPQAAKAPEAKPPKGKEK